MSTPTAVFPGAVATDAQLKVANNLIQTTLRATCGATDTVLSVVSTTGFVANGLISIDQEIVAIVSVQASPANTLTVAANGRGFDGTAAAQHAAGATVSMFIDAWHHNVLSAEVKAIEQFIGVNGQNVVTGPFLLAPNYNFAPQTPGGSLSPGSNVITLSPVPPGVNGGNVGYQIYISGGTGAAEAATVTGGTAVAGAPTGTLIVTCANSHTGAWTVSSTSGGIQEAVCALPTEGGVVIAPQDVTLRANVVKAGKTQPSVWKLAGATISGSFSVLEQISSPNPSEWVTGPHEISALLGTFNNSIAALLVIPQGHDPFPASYGAGVLVGQSDPTQLSMNQFFHGLVCDVHTSNPTPNQNAAVLGFTSSHGGADPFGADFHANVPSTATAAPVNVIGTQAQTQVDIAAPSALVYPLLLVHSSAAGKSATAMIKLSASGSGASLLLTTDSNVMTMEGVVLVPANDLNPLYRAFAVTNAANTTNTAFITKNGLAYFGSSLVGQTWNFIANETGANNAIAGAFTNVIVPALTTGFPVMIKLAHSLQAGPNTFNLNATGAVAIKSHFNPSNDIATAYAVGTMFFACYNGAVWCDMSQ